MPFFALVVSLLLSIEVVGPDSEVRPLAAAPAFMAPSGKATIRHLARGQQAYVGRLEMDAGAAVPEHADATEEYIHVLEGEGVITIDGKASPVKAGDTVFMKANARVSYQNGPAKMVALQVFAGPAPADKYEQWKPLK
ncbi:MAG: cupin domain-containing protein [bacterium]